MAEIRVQNLHKAFADFVAVKDSTLHRARRRVLLPARPLGLRQDDDAAHDRRARAADRGPDLPRRRGRDLQARLAARHRLRVPAVRALPAHERAQEHRLPAASRRACRAREIDAKVEEAARILRITHLLDKPVSGLSSGDRQRVALGRAIVRQPLAFLMDEPLGALDSEFRELMCDELRGLHDRLKATTVYVTHDQMEAMAMADTIAIMNHGVIEQLGAPQEVYDRPASRVRRRLHRRAVDELPALRRRLRGRRAPRCSIGAARVARAGRCAEAVRRARSCCAACGPSTCASTRARALRAEVLGSEYLGHSQIVTLTTARGLDAARQGRRRGAGAARRPRRPGLRRRRRCRCSTSRAAARWRWTAAPSRSRSVRPLMAELRLDGVGKRFGSVQAVHDLSLDIASGEFIVLLGPSGAGKTTTLRLVAGLEKPDAGRVHIGGRDVTARAPALRDVTFVFQQYSLYPHLSVFDNLAFPLRSPMRRMRRGRGARQGARGGAAAAHRRQARQPGHQALGRPDAARGDRPRAGARPGGDADGRAAVVARRQAAQRPAPGAEAHPAGPGRDHALRHPRPDRGADAGRRASACSTTAGWCRSAARARSTRTRRPATVAARLGSPRINLLPRAALGDWPAPAGAATVGVRAEHLQRACRRRRAGGARCAPRCAASSS